MRDRRVAIQTGGDSSCATASQKQCRERGEGTASAKQWHTRGTATSSLTLRVSIRPLRGAFTLLEVILAAALAVVILGLLTMAIHVHLRVADASRSRVEEAQLARTLLERIAEDLRNSLPYVPPPSSGTSTPSGTSGSSGPSSIASAASIASLSGTGSSPDASGSSTLPSSGGVFGSVQELQVETSRRPRPNPAMPPPDTTVPARLSDIRTVTYSLGPPGTTYPPQRGVSSDPAGGLYRRELDRAEFAWSSQQGQTDDLDRGTELLAPEVVDLQFSYYDSSTTNDTWDSIQNGKLPTAVKVSIAIRRAAPKTTDPGMAAADAVPPTVYDMLIDLPNSQAKAVAAPTPAAQAAPQPKEATKVGG